MFTGEVVRGRRTLVLLEPQQELVRGKLITVPAGATSNGASTPEFSDKLFGFDPFKLIYFRAAVFHDYLYETNMYSRCECDLIFLALIMKTDRKLYKKLFFGIIMFTAVRLFGRKYYDRHYS